jgi:hypothetical protein
MHFIELLHNIIIIIINFSYNNINIIHAACRAATGH